MFALVSRGTCLNRRVIDGRDKGYVQRFRQHEIFLKHGWETFKS